MKHIVVKNTVLTLCLILNHAIFAAHEVLIEAESFQEKAGWKVDQQFTHIVGSPYLLAHGLGVPVENAKTQVSFPALGDYRLWVRTKNLVPGDWQAPGRFEIMVDGKTIPTVFGTESGWKWQNGGTVTINKEKCLIELKDLTGFEGRCDAIFFTTDKAFNPPNTIETMRDWRNRLCGIPAVPQSVGNFDLVVVGGGIAGCAACLAAQRQGLKVALIHDRPVLGGNAGSEVRVHTEGIPGRGSNILKGIDTIHWPNGAAEAIEDTIKRKETMDSASGVTQFLSWRAYAANTKANRIISVDAKHIETGQTKRFQAPIFIDCTGDGWIGYWAGAEYRYGRESRDEFNESWDKYGDLWSPEKPDNKVMGASVLWNTHRVKEAAHFPQVPWAMDVAKDNIALAGEWYWEYSSDDKHQIDDAEEIRDHLFRAIYGSFYNAKRNPDNSNIQLQWIAFIAGKRESRRLMGDYIYTLKDMTEGRYFADTVAEETRNVDIHYQKNLAAGDDSKYDFLAKAIYRKTDKYYIPFRCLYSKNIDNLMMAGRCFSCSHVGLGGPRVMNTTGQMGLATGFAAAICKIHDTTPRGVYKEHLQELRTLIGYFSRECQF